MKETKGYGKEVVVKKEFPWLALAIGILTLVIITGIVIIIYTLKKQRGGVIT